MATIQFKRGTAAQAATANPVLAAGEPGFETDTGKFKIGDGTTAWNSLAYAGKPTIDTAPTNGSTNAVSSDGVYDALALKDSITPTTNAQTGTAYTLQASDNGKIVTMNNASANVVTVPSGLGAGFNCAIVQLGAGQTSVVASGTTLNSADGLKIDVQYAGCSLWAYSANTFLLSGRLTT
jgi:hypothetical protein